MTSIPRLAYRRLWLAVGAAGLAATLAGSLVPVTASVAVPAADKAVHVVVYAGLMLWFGALVATGAQRLGVAAALLIFGASIEWLQGATSSLRHAEAGDVLANVAGLLLALAALRTLLSDWLVRVDAWMAARMRRY